MDNFEMNAAKLNRRSLFLLQCSPKQISNSQSNGSRHVCGIFESLAEPSFQKYHNTFHTLPAIPEKIWVREKRSRKE
jgi:hypothetical protein